MRAFPRIFGYAAMVLTLCTISACSGVKDTVAIVKPYSPSAERVLLSSVSARALTVQPFTMVRGIGELPGRIGERTTIGGVTMGYVTLNPPPEELFTEAIKSELVAGGHNVAGGPKKVSGVVERFALSTPATAMYWDVTIDAALKVSVGNTTRSYAEVCVSRTYAWPSDKIISEVSSECVSRIVQKFANDESIANAL